MMFFDEDLICNTSAVQEQLEPAFPLRATLGESGFGISSTGGQIPTAFSPILGGQIFKATRDDGKGQMLKTLSGEDVIVSHVWTLLGAWPDIPTEATLREMEGSTIRGEYKVLSVDVHPHRLHTELKTAKVIR